MPSAPQGRHGPDLDAWVPDAVVRTRHQRRVAASPEGLWAAASAVRLDETRSLGRLIRWRIPGVPGDQTFRGLLESDPFTVLEQGERYVLSGLCGRIWTLQRDYPRLDGPQAFREWDEAGTVRVAFGHWVVGEGDHGSVIVSEAR